MKYLFYTILLITLLTSCKKDLKKAEEKELSYTDKTVEQFNKLTPPIVLTAKTKSLDRYSVIVTDSTGKTEYYGNRSGLARSIGDSYEAGDTIKHQAK